MTSSRAARLAGILLLPVLGLTACTGDDGLDTAVGDLTTALEGHALDGIEIAGGDAGEFSELVEPLAGQPVTVEAGEIAREGGSATVPLSWAWSIDDREWTYETTATLTDGDDAWILEWDPSLVADGLEAGERIELTREHPERAEILGADDEVLVTERPVTRYGLDKSWIDEDQVASSAEAIAEAVGIDPDEFAARAEQMGELAFVEAIVLRPEGAAERVADGYAEIPGANAVDDTMLLAPTREFARDLLGSVGEATAEIIEASEGEIREGDQVGLSGVQAAYDEELRGTPAITISAVSGEGDDAERRDLISWDAEEADPLVTTLDVDMQNRADAVLADVAGTSALVAIRPSSGEILAASDGPASEIPNAATAGQYAPGSTFKVATALALLRAGAAPGDVVTCAATVTVDGYAFHNYDDYPAGATGDITLREAIANSCNTALIGQRGILDDDALAEAARSLGLGVEADLGIPAFLGSVPEAEGETEFAADMIGQGRVLASPLAMATAAASVSAGSTVTPHLIAGEEPEAEAPAVALAADEAETLRDLMRAVVTEGSATFLSGLEPAVGAKTGTAEYGEPDDDGNLPVHGWMIGTQGDLAVAVFVDDAESGSETAGPILEAFLR
ncbi:penicillin-binding transpeptidase domain-containing protein [Microbacterium karelineae]|uniref:penicillin-binding transpeptidase domain-containing protein n=1 Tax=Microbacterium karelineae TaxID=2654283 RepID=UPI0018D451A9|nr:penicillin-binding transpeptidase domain-containing protein [Microbacterium karelineae]